MNDAVGGAEAGAMDPTGSPAAAAGTAAPAAYRLALRFTGSGSEYFRIWIVNLLLTLVTLGLYFPFAKVRRLRYFYNNTKLGGEEFDFHGNPWKMLRGFLLMAGLFGAYALGTRASPVAALVALLAMAVIWPLLFRASMQFRLSNTSWRGLRFHFEGTPGGAYSAMGPLLIALLMYLGGAAFLRGDATQGEPDAVAEPASAAVAVMGIGVLLLLLLAPWFWYSIKRYQHGHYALGPMRTELRAKAASFYAVFLRTAGLSLLCIAPVVAVGIGAAVIARGGGKSFGAVLGFGAVLVIVAMLSYLAMLVITNSFISARLQNLVWGSTRGRDVKFASHLKVRALAKLTAKNWLLTGLTLGLYLPFARVARARLMIESVEVTTRHPPHVLTAALRGMHGDAAGDASADLLGLDVGL